MHVLYMCLDSLQSLLNVQLVMKQMLQSSAQLNIDSLHFFLTVPANVTQTSKPLLHELCINCKMRLCLHDSAHVPAQCILAAATPFVFLSFLTMLSECRMPIP